MSNTEFSPIDKSFLDQDFGLKELIDAFEMPIQPMCSLGKISLSFKCAVQASMDLPICYMNEWGISGFDSVAGALSTH